MNKLKLVFLLYPLAIIGLFIYSFTQVDLSLTLSKVSIYQFVEKYLQHIGFFDRPLSTVIYVVILGLLMMFYLIFLRAAFKKRISPKQVWKLIIFTTVVLAFSYNAFSYDLFNYIFDAKILTHYHQIPYFYSALNFPNDPMLSFMRWTHRTFPYGPSWLALTAPLSFIGMNVFLPTFFLFKFLAALSFLGSCYLIYKISEKIFPQDSLLNLAFFAFNPLVLIECLVSAHNDIPMIFFLLLSIYLFLNKRNISSFLLYLFSIGIKFSTGILLPLAVFAFLTRKRQINWENVFTVAVVLSLLTVVLATVRTLFQPWYFIFPISLASFLTRKPYILILGILISAICALLYAPYVYMTDYAKGYPTVIWGIEAAGLIVILLTASLYLLKSKLFRQH